MRFLHTSDWHLGRALFGKKRYDEFESFLQWLAETIDENNIEALLVAGDVFDTGLPSNKAQELYYKFLFNISSSSCRHVVITGGNHDSPSFLNAPKELLKILNVHVVGMKTDEPEDEVIILNDNENTPEAIVLAVPYLRDRDIRTVEPGETIEDKTRKIIEGIKDHYQEVAQIADNIRKDNPDIPIIGMGHLFTSGARTTDDDGVRELYVGSLAHIDRDSFPSVIDYMALGHLHVPQKAGNSEKIRYSGSPLPIGFGEANQKKSVLMIDFNKNIPNVNEIDIPVFHELIRIKGTYEQITEKIRDLTSSNKEAYVEIEHTGSHIPGKLRVLIDELTEDSALEVLKITDRNTSNEILKRLDVSETLEDLDPYDVFNRKLELAGIPEDEKKPLIESYSEIINSIEEEDINAE